MPANPSVTACDTHRRFVVSVLIPDRVGILRDITTAVSSLGANIDDISQTVLEGCFTVILTLTLDAPATPAVVRSALADRLAGDAADVAVRPLLRPPGAAAPTVSGERFVVTVSGRDRPGILRTVMTLLAARSINVEDWNVLRDGDGIMYVGEVTVPSALDIRQLQADLQTALDPLGLRSGVQHENIFRATSEVGAIRHLLGN